MKNLREYWGNIGIIGAMLTNTLLPVCVGGWVWLCVFVLVCLCSCMYVCTYVCIYICIYVCVCL